MIKYASGDIIQTECYAIVNPCNVVGVAGAGISKKIKEKYPEVYRQYRQECRDGIIDINTHLRFHLTGDEKHMIIHLPTKEHWRQKSDIRIIKSGLLRLKTLLEDIYYKKDIAIPALGCGCGQLAWNDVKPCIEAIAYSLPKIDWEIYGPH